MNTKQFKFGKISEELKEMFLSFGIKKKDLERDADFAFTLFKKVIVGLGSENKLKNSALDSIEHNFPPPEERERLRKQEELAEAKMNSIKNKKRQQTKKTVAKTNYRQSTTKSSSYAPTSNPTPTPAPAAPKVVAKKAPTANSEAVSPSFSRASTTTAAVCSNNSSSPCFKSFRIK